MGDISPVLESFLAGQKQQTDILKTAHDLVNMQMERKQRQEEIDNTMKRFDVSSKLEQQRVDLEHQSATDTHNLHLINARRQFMQDLASGVQAPQTNNDAVSVPEVPQSGLSSMSGPQFPIPGVQSPATSQAMQSMDTPMGKITVPMPQTDVQRAVASQQALAPGILEAEKQKSNFEADAYVKKMMPEVNAKIEMQKAIADARIDTMNFQMSQREKMNDVNAAMREKVAEIGANSRVMNMMMMNGINPDPDAFKKQVGNVMHLAATGQVEGNLSQIYGPIIGRAAESGLASAGQVLPKAGTRAAVMGLGSEATRFLNTVDNLKQNAPVPKNLIGAVSNVIADKTGISGLSPYKSIFDSLQTQIVPGLDVALGLTPGTLARSPKLYDKLRSIAPLPGDKPDVVEEKRANGVDIYLSAAAKKLSGLQPEQRKLFWQDLANDNPKLIQANPSLREKIFKAGDTGNYEPGNLFKTWSSSLGVQ